MAISDRNGLAPLCQASSDAAVEKPAPVARRRELTRIQRVLLSGGNEAKKPVSLPKLRWLEREPPPDDREGGR